MQMLQFNFNKLLAKIHKSASSIVAPRKRAPLVPFGMALSTCFGRWLSRSGEGGVNLVLWNMLVDAWEWCSKTWLRDSSDG